MTIKRLTEQDIKQKLTFNHDIFKSNIKYRFGQKVSEPIFTNYKLNKNQVKDIKDFLLYNLNKEFSINISEKTIETYDTGKSQGFEFIYNGKKYVSQLPTDCHEFANKSYDLEVKANWLLEEFASKIKNIPILLINSNNYC